MTSLKNRAKTFFGFENVRVSPVMLLLMQSTMIFLMVYTVYKIFALKVEVGSFSIAVQEDPALYVFLFAIAAFITILHFTVRSKYPKTHLEFKLLPEIFRHNAKAKLKGAKSDVRFIALFLVEMGFVSIIALSIAAYLDPEWEIIQWRRFGVFPPFDAVFNAVLFILILALLHYSYGRTKDFRIEHHGKIGKTAQPEISKPAKIKSAKKKAKTGRARKKSG